MTLNKEYNNIEVKHIPHTFHKQGREKLEKKKIEELDIFFQVIRMDIEEEKEIYNLNH